MPSGFASTTESFIAKAHALHGDKYDYSQVVYQNAHKKVTIVCPEHGAWDQTPSNHLHPKKYGCKLCGKELGRQFFLKDHEEIMQRFVARWGNKFDYSKTQYVDYKTKVTIGCPVHGDFQIHAHIHHQSIFGCPRCSEEAHPGKYNLKFFQRYPDQHNIPGVFYIIDLDSHLKIGITKNGFHNRHHNRTARQIVNTTLHTAFLIEHELKQRLSNQYVDKSISGKTECFLKSESNDSILKEVLNKYGFEYEH